MLTHFVTVATVVALCMLLTHHVLWMIQFNTKVNDVVFSRLIKRLNEHDAKIDQIASQGGFWFPEETEAEASES